jgi:hypothetical protein
VKRGDTYRVMIGERDPGLVPGPLADAIEAAACSVEPRMALFAGGMEYSPPAGRPRLALAVRCAESGCGRVVARVWRAPQGLLYQAVLLDSFTRWQGVEDPVIMVHPDLPGQPAEVARRSLDRVWRTKGWSEAPPGTRLPRRFKPAFGVLVHDLLDFDSDQHPVLLARCPRHGGTLTLDRYRLLDAARSAASPATPIPTHEVRRALS